MSVSEFVDEYFQRRPLALSRKRPRLGRFDFLFREDEFVHNLDRVQSIRAVFVKNRQAQIKPTEIKDMMGAGATICVTGMEGAHPRLGEAAKRIQAELAYSGRVSFRAYLSPPGKGFAVHFDARVATTLQISGTKKWWYSEEPAIPFPAFNSGKEPSGFSAEYERPDLSGMRQVVLRPGDVLCLPAGVWHAAEAGPQGSLALNMAFDHNFGSAFDAVMRLLQPRLLRQAAWREPLPLTANVQGRRLPAKVASVLQQRLDTLCSEIRSIRDDDAALRRAWSELMESER
ncbi:MAG TPA: cupin domain-containing protein [Burkholderiales bacterium]|nr:cupin domain-containing protein [Burkholderiales bacterium]